LSFWNIRFWKFDLFLFTDVKELNVPKQLGPLKKSISATGPA